MKSFIKSLTVAVALLALCLSASAQGSFDVFGGTRTVVVAPPSTILYTVNSTFTNYPIDIHRFTGVGKMDLFAQTNVNSGTCTVDVQTSSDCTNWIALANYAKAVSTTVNLTNQMPNTAPVVTNTFLLPGTVTTPTVGTAGFASPYLLSAPFTNSGSITIPASGVASIGFQVDDALRYVRTIWTPAGAGTNLSIAATLTGKYQFNSTVP